MPNKKNRKPRSDSTEAQAEIAMAAGRKIVSDVIELNDLEEKFFQRIIGERVKADWTEHRIDAAAILSKLMADVVTDPAQRGIASKHNAIISYRRSLGIHSRAQDGEMQDFEKRREVAREMESGLLVLEDDDLIARPPVH